MRTQVVTYGIKVDPGPLPCGFVVIVGFVCVAINEPELFVAAQHEPKYVVTPPWRGHEGLFFN